MAPITRRDVLFGPYQLSVTGCCCSPPYSPGSSSSDCSVASSASSGTACAGDSVGSAVPVALRAGNVSRANSHNTNASNVIPPVMANEARNDQSSAMAPATSGPLTAPMSAIIWNPASTPPPRASLPSTSASAALCAGFTEPEPTPAINDANRKNQGSADWPSNTAPSASNSNPTTAGGLRPRESLTRPATNSAPALPTPKTANAIPANDSEVPMTFLTNSGMSEVRIPSTTQPLMKFDPSAARQVAFRMACRNVMVG